QEAVDDFNQLGADAAQHPDIAYGLGLALDKLGRREEANQAFKRYLELAPNGPWAKQARDFLTRPRLGG
ncbi:MAG: tetratricopeptide repeat protein, partial [Desulfobacteraceae bacterium]|nr:tetratricopeptide repeat protein [Desulfobacteraceae bacterium]